MAKVLLVASPRVVPIPKTVGTHHPCGFPGTQSSSGRKEEEREPCQAWGVRPTSYKGGQAWK